MTKEEVTKQLVSDILKQIVKIAETHIDDGNKIDFTIDIIINALGNFMIEMIDDKTSNQQIRDASSYVVKVMEQWFESYIKSKMN